MATIALGHLRGGSSLRRLDTGNAEVAHLAMPQCMERTSASTPAALFAAVRSKADAGSGWACEPRLD
jgi:hypothetical protein